ncbi:hypothetical protein SAMN04489712_10672 [Thermomonospora echinospora]|uniref:Uncharacterized protein n=1 Tax=Thermomonospora echinospora TaxID=1992 RepID=A0A1H6AXI1_9ACTN|nr:hypothetical protein [Thermomonospora echinospora]SEG53092.1 hypothetical protein SAMN04489712_10672 [Thermomonospora echinospora]
MVDENALRFVVVRPPVLDESRGRVIVDTETADAVLGRIQAKRSARAEVTWADAAAAVGAEIVSDAAYWPDSPSFSVLGFDTGYVRELLEWARDNPDDPASFLPQAQRWLDRATPSRGDVREWVAGREYRAARDSAWLSWYGFVLHQDRRPQQAPGLAGSLVFLELLGAAVGDRDRFRRTAVASRTEGPAVRPDVLLGPRPVATAPDTTASDAAAPEGARSRQAAAESDERIDPWLIENIRNLRDARTAVQAFFDAKLGRQRAVTYYVTSVDSTEPNGPVGFEGIEQSAPWRVTQAELDADEGLAEALRQADFDLARDTLPEALERIDASLADLTQRLYARRRDTRVTVADGRHVRVVTNSRPTTDRPG